MIRQLTENESATIFGIVCHFLSKNANHLLDPGFLNVSWSRQDILRHHRRMGGVTHKVVEQHSTLASLKNRFMDCTLHYGFLWTNYRKYIIDLCSKHPGGEINFIHIFNNIKCQIHIFTPFQNVLSQSINICIIPFWHSDRRSNQSKASSHGFHWLLIYPADLTERLFLK